MRRAVSVGDRQLLTQGVYGDRLFFGGAASTCGRIGVPNFPDDVIGVETTAVVGGYPKDPFGFQNSCH